MYTRGIIGKVPGKIPIEAKKERQGYIGDLSLKTTPQLKELLERQVKLLTNKAFTNKLADRGEKISRLKQAIEEVLKKQDESENLSKMMSSLSINSIAELDAVEWTGRCAPGHIMSNDNGNISDDEQDPLKILATHSGAGFHKKKQIVLKPEVSLIRPSDIAGDGKEDEGEVLEEFAKHLCEKYDTLDSTSHPKAKFLPFKTLIHSTSEKKEPKIPGKWWEVTAATPPLPVHGDTKLVSLQESMTLLSTQQQTLKEIQLEHVAERLSASYNCSIGHPSQTTGDYRDHSCSDSELSDQEVHDEEYPDTGGVVVYNLVDDIKNDQQ